MTTASGTQSRGLLKRLRDTLALPGEGQDRLDRITRLIAESMAADVCSIYLLRDPRTLELCATEGLNPQAVHVTRLRIGEGLVGRVAAEAQPVNTGDAPSERGFRYMPETGEEVYSAFLGVPIQRLGETLGVLVVQSRQAGTYPDEAIDTLEVVAMVLAEMAELGAFVNREGAGGPMAPHRHPVMFRGVGVQEGAAAGQVHLHEPRVVISNPVADDPARELARFRAAMDELRGHVDDLLAVAMASASDEQRQVMEAYRMFANSRGWAKRIEADIESGLSAEAAVEKEQSEVRARMSRVPDPYLRERLHDLDDLSNRLLRGLTGQGQASLHDLPEDPILVARNIGPGELLEYGRRLKGVVLEEGSVGSHAAIVARALAIPLVVQAARITTTALNGDPILVDGDHGIVHLRPEDSVAAAFQDKMAMLSAAQHQYALLRDKPALSTDGQRVRLKMNAGLMADLPSLRTSGAEGVGLFRTELQFLTRSTVPRRTELAALYSRVLDAAGDKPVVFRTLDIGSDKVLPYMRREEEPNPALGWRAIRVGLDRRGVLRMQLQALLRAANGRPLSVMFPFVAQMEEFCQARAVLDEVMSAEARHGHPVPEQIEVGAMLETPSLAFAPKKFFDSADFISIGGNDLKQFFFAADRENERVRRRYDTLNVSYLDFIRQIVARCEASGTPLSFCGEDAGRPVEALCLAAMGLRILSMRPASIGPVKALIRKADLGEVRKIIEAGLRDGEMTVRPQVEAYVRGLGDQIA